MSNRVGFCVGMMIAVAQGGFAQSTAAQSTARDNALGVAQIATQSGNTPMEPPMSAIEWLDRRMPSSVAQPPRKTMPGEPPVTKGAGVPAVAVTPLDGDVGGAVGLLPASVTGLPIGLWSGSQSAMLIQRIARLDVADMPAMVSLLYALMLAESEPPKDQDGTDLLLARVDKLIELGAVEPALALIEQARPERAPALFTRYFDLSLLAGTEDEACARIEARPSLAPGYGARIYCLARRGDWRTAALTFASVRALGVLAPDTALLLERYLDAELSDGAPPLKAPGTITPLIFRLHEAIGQPLSVSTLPRAYAMADLRNISGWKAELEAVERLARTGALSENRLIGVYSSRRPAASGGVWDRVAAVQALDAAIERSNVDAVGDTITAAWAGMRAARLEVPFAKLFGGRLIGLEGLNGPARRVAFRTAMLSPDYERAAGVMVPEGREETFLVALARGKVDETAAYSAQSRAVARVFSGNSAAAPEVTQMVSEGRLGEAILGAMARYGNAMQGEAKDAVEALAALRAVGLEDTARRAALQMLILDRRS